jgi:hypothetical protein
MTDLDSLAACARKTGMKANNFNVLFNKHLTEPKDSLWIDLTTTFPAPLRKNGYEVLTKHDGIKTKKELEGDTFSIE